MTAHVLAALRHSSAFKVRYAYTHLPPARIEHFLEFSGVVGTWYYDRLFDGSQRYLRFLLKKLCAVP